MTPTLTSTATATATATVTSSPTVTPTMTASITTTPLPSDTATPAEVAATETTTTEAIAFPFDLVGMDPVEGLNLDSSFEVSAPDDMNLSEVRLMWGDQVLLSDTEAPFEINLADVDAGALGWEAGEQALTLVGVDADGNEFSQQVMLDVPESVLIADVTEMATIATTEAAATAGADTATEVGTEVGTKVGTEVATSVVSVTRTPVMDLDTESGENPVETVATDPTFFIFSGVLLLLLLLAVAYSRKGQAK
ncbi:hypothetical protein MASR2M15_01070 [Anaerolineales bacterium]